MAKKQAAAKGESSPPPTEAIVRANINRELVPSDEYVSLYTNDTQIQISPWDFRFLFGVIATMPSPESTAVSIKQLGEVHMSPQHAKKVALVLLQQIKNYEDNIGPIPLPSD